MRYSSGRLRVVFVTTGYPTRYRPNDCIFLHRSIKALSQWIEARVIHLRAWRPGRPLVEERKWEGIKVLSVSCPQLPLGSYLQLNTTLLSAFGALSVKSTIAAADIVHSMDIYPAGFVASQWARRFSKPHSTHVIGSDLNLFLPLNLSHIGTKWISNLDGVVCNSQAIKGQLISLVPGLRNLKVIYRGVDTKKFSPDGPLSGPQVSMPPVRFLYLGGFRTWNSHRGEYNIKGGHTLLEAWTQVEERLAPSSLVIGGPGTDTENLRLWRTRLRSPKEVFITDTISPDMVASWMRACNVVVIPSLQEGLPNVANEAQACGRPVLGTDAGGIPESVIQGETGLIVPRGDPHALAQGMGWFWANQSKLHNMGSQGRERMLQKFTWDRFSLEMNAFFSAVV
jgi:glycosyltransferase involved in cell wall biosynthesis